MTSNGNELENIDLFLNKLNNFKFKTKGPAIKSGHVIAAES